MKNYIEQLRKFAELPIDWELGPEDAVTLYLEWGNNNWHADHPPVRSKEDFAHYFVVDNWEEEPLIRLVRRNSENAEDLLTMPLPEELKPHFLEEFGSLKGIFAPSAAIKDWLRTHLYS